MNQPAILELQPVGERPLTEQPQPAALAVADNSPASTMMRLLERGASLADVREMMAIQREWDADQARKAFREDFAAFRGENIIIPKSKHVDRGKAGSFNQAEYDQVAGRLSPALSRHGFGFRHDEKFGVRRIMREGVESDEGWVWVTCFLEHRKGHTESLTLEGPPGDLTANTPVQNMQVTASYLKRQSVLAITGTATGGEDDEAKMRREPTEQPGDEDPDADALTSGNKAAMGGMTALLKWWRNLDAKQRGRLQKEYGSLRRTAQGVDDAR